MQRWFQVPHPLELPRVRRPVVPLMGSGDAFIGKLVSHRLPRLTAVVRALNDLPRPAARLRCVETVRIGRRAFQVVNIPACKVRPAHLPLLALSVRSQQERTFVRTHQHPYFTHLLIPSDSLLFLELRGQISRVAPKYLLHWVPENMHEQRPIRSLNTAEDGALICVGANFFAGGPLLA